jgi:hypothetical protein
MSTVGNTFMTLADLYKRQDPDKSIADIIEMMNEINPILSDAIAMECNDGMSHLTTVRTGLPTATWRMLYQGTQPQKSTTKQIRDSVGMAENWSEVDAKLVDLSANPGAFRLSEAVTFVEGLGQAMAKGMFYGNQDTDPEKFTGLAPRFNDLSAENGKQIVDAGAAKMVPKGVTPAAAVAADGNCTSIWMVVWGERSVHCLYPRGSRAGLQRDDKGMTTKELSDGSMYDVYREKFSWDIGMTVRDWRYVSRIANISVPRLQAGEVDIYKALRQAYYKLYQRRISNGRAAIYCNTDVMEALDAMVTDGNNVRLRYTEVEGVEVLTYRGIPIRETDAIMTTEALVS